VLLLALLLLAVALHREWRLGERRWWPGVPPLRELLPLVLLLAATWLLNIAPLLTYGTLIPIGDNWDVEFYLPLADYLKDYSYLTLSQAPANPLRDLLLTERLSARAMGATYAQAMADLLVYREAWDSWVPMLAVLRLLTLAGLYALLRGGLQVRPAGALAGVALAGLNSLLLWTTYNSFGMSTGGLALLPAALLLLLFALEEGRSRVLFGAAFLLAGLTCTYWPMLMAYGAAGLGIGLAVLAESRAKAQRRKGPGRMELFPGRGEDSEMRGGGGGQIRIPVQALIPRPLLPGGEGAFGSPSPPGRGVWGEGYARGEGEPPGRRVWGEGYARWGETNVRLLAQRRGARCAGAGGGRVACAAGASAGYHGVCRYVSGADAFDGGGGVSFPGGYSWQCAFFASWAEPI
jgi:hypothetical protein